MMGYIVRVTNGPSLGVLPWLKARRD